MAKKYDHPSAEVVKPAAGKVLVERFSGKNLMVATGVKSPSAKAGERVTMQALVKITRWVDHNFFAGNPLSGPRNVPKERMEEFREQIDKLDRNYHLTSPQQNNVFENKTINRRDDTEARNTSFLRGVNEVLRVVARLVDRDSHPAQVMPSNDSTDLAVRIAAARKLSNTLHGLILASSSDAVGFDAKESIESLGVSARYVGEIIRRLDQIGVDNDISQGIRDCMNSFVNTEYFDNYRGLFEKTVGAMCTPPATELELGTDTARIHGCKFIYNVREGVRHESQGTIQTTIQAAFPSTDQFLMTLTNMIDNKINALNKSVAGDPEAFAGRNLRQRIDALKVAKAIVLPDGNLTSAEIVGDVAQKNVQTAGVTTTVGK